ncbi:hypothetical protein GCM10027160_27030 [Streptomyces calidiresistens]|uniref:Acyl carrier protein n=2 Tax=Streptomyces TaxID=1883 RepID=A0A7W3Y2I6_9ACTN|nr:MULTISPECIES: acyl carrier protein [Streptomyces]MBB0231839.1 acyl carrier protein [Streptomyces calidiresistens]MBB0245799.1 acyl carrier protein [Streptomyces alkaliphilus]MQS09021.1 acyl carrier protein [Streptomyces alkaliphilus]
MTIDAVTGLDREELRELLAETIDADVAEIRDGADFVESLGVDSLMALEVVVVLERRYGIKFAETEMRSVRTLESTYDLLCQKLRECS